MTAGTTAALRRQFVLPEDDIAGLDALGFKWETAVVSGVQWLFVHDVPLPSGYQVSHGTIAVRIVPGYPTAQLDMVYVDPPLQRQDHRPIRALTPTIIEGRTFQQWSRHYTRAHPWRPGVDSVVSHLRAAEEWFARAAK